MEMDFLLGSFEVDWKSNMTRPMYQAYWKANENRFTPEFRQFINDINLELERQ